MLEVSWSFIWLGIIIVGIIAEIVTVGLSAVWFSCGAACAYVAGRLGCSENMQIAVFLGVSFGLSYFFRPYALKLLCKRKSVNHAKELIGQRVHVIATVNNAAGEGKVLVDHMEWRAKSKRDEYIFERGDEAVIESMEGIVLILVPVIPLDNAMVET